jgi:translation initiation factor IF-2
MRVYEVAKEFDIEAEKLMQLLRTLGARVRSEASQVDDATVAKLRARFERERRAGHADVDESLDAVIEHSQTTTRRRRRRKAADLPPIEEPEDAEAAAVLAEDDAAETSVEEVAGIDAGPTPPVEVEEPTVEELPEPAAAEAAAEPVVAEAETFESVDAMEPIEAVEEEEEAEVEVEPAPEPAVPTETERPAAAARPAPSADVRPRLRRAAEVLGRTPPRQERPAAPAPAASAGPGGQVRIQAEGFTTDGRRKKEKRKKKQRRVDQEAVQENVARVMSELKGSSGRRRRHRRDAAEIRQEREEERKQRAAEEAKTVRVNEFLTVAELAELIDESPTAIISSAFKYLGLMVTINQRLDFDQIELLLEEFGFRAMREEEYAAEALAEQEEEDKPEDLVTRPPIVTVMGHVDHGKTSLLDYIRKTNVIAGESGGITQHIGAYHVELTSGRTITFLDTPGHAAFTAMRARGAELTDVVILVVAADDSVMPQTVEAISHANNAGVPMIVAINKVDVPGANPTKIKQDLLKHGVVVEEFGGDVLAAEVSAKKGTNIDDLLEKVLLQSDLLDLKANPNREAQGTVVEAQLDVGKGPVATVLVTNGTLHVGDSFVCGHYDGRIRALLDERGKITEQAGPGLPVQVLGIAGVPQAGDVLVVMDAERASEIAQTRQRLEREKQLRIKGRGVKLTDISRMLARGEQATLNLIIKGDVDGSVQALSDALGQLSTTEVQIEVIHRGVGAINESDVLLAATAGAIIIGFHVRPGADSRALAQREGVDIRLYSIIYEAVEDVRAALEGMLTPEEKEVLLGEAEVRQLFRVPRAGTVAGCYVTEGVIDRRGRVRIVRDGVQVYEGELASLKRFKDDVREVREGFECGMSIAGYNDLKIGDRIECYRVESVARTLAGASGSEG